MNQEDIIYIPITPVSDGKFEVTALLNGHKFGVLRNQIVMTIEELRECFKWGMDSFEDTQTPAQSFNDFLQSKGINIP